MKSYTIATRPIGSINGFTPADNIYGLMRLGDAMELAQTLRTELNLDVVAFNTKAGF